MTRPTLDAADFRLLRVFVTIVERGGFAAAEVPLGLSLSTISGQMKALETRLGLTLCTRGRAGFRLTEAGEAVYAEARQLIAASQGFSNRIAGLKDRLAGPVRIGTLDATITDPNSRLTDALATYAEAAPESEIRFVTKPPDELLARHFRHRARRRRGQLPPHRPRPDLRRSLRGSPFLLLRLEPPPVHGAGCPDRS